MASWPGVLPVVAVLHSRADSPVQGPGAEALDVTGAVAAPAGAVTPPVAAAVGPAALASRARPERPPQSRGEPPAGVHRGGEGQVAVHDFLADATPSANPSSYR